LNFGQSIWDKSEVILGTTWGTLWEYIRNMTGQREKAKNSSPTLSFPKRKELDPSCVHAEPFIGCMELLFPKLFVTIFGLG
jgi:hypothetical protein